MPEPEPILVVNVSLASSERDYDAEVEFLDHTFRLIRLGTDGDVDAAVRLMRDWDDQAAAIAVTRHPRGRAAGLYDGELEAVEQVMAAAADRATVADGHALRDVLQEWAIRHFQSDEPGFFNNARTVVLGGLNHARTTRILREYTDNIEFADPLLRLDLPARIDANPALGLAANIGIWPLHQLPTGIKSRIKAPGQQLSMAMARKAARDCDVVVATYDELIGFGLEDLAGKTLVTAAISDDRLAELAGRGVDIVLDSTPQPFEDVTVSRPCWRR